MTTLITIEPDENRRSLFALWAIGQDPPVRTSGPNSFDVPLDLYPYVPADLLEGAVVDGFHHDRQMPQPEAAPAPETAPRAAVKEPAKKAARRVPKSLRGRAVSADETDAVILPIEGD